MFKVNERAMFDDDVTRVKPRATLAESEGDSIGGRYLTEEVESCEFGNFRSYK